MYFLSLGFSQSILRLWAATQIENFVRRIPYNVQHHTRTKLSLPPSVFPLCPISTTILFSASSAECSNLREALEEGVAAEAEADSSLETPGPDTGGEASLTTNKESAARTRIDQAKIKSLERSSKGEAAKV